MHTYAHSNSHDDRSGELLTVAQAARLLGVHASTVRRWIDHGKLPAFRVGQKGIRIRHDDLDGLLTPLPHDGQTGGSEVIAERLGIRPLTEEGKRQALAAVEDARRAQAAMLQSRGGKLFSSSSELLNEAREQRTEQLLRRPS